MPILSIHIRSFYLKHLFKKPKHAKEHDDFVKKYCCIRKDKDLRSKYNAETTYLNLN